MKKRIVVTRLLVANPVVSAIFLEELTVDASHFDKFARAAI